MGRKSKTEQLTEAIRGQHVALSVAAGLARTQIVSDPLRVYDAEHLTGMLDVIARALAKVAQIYVRDTKSDEPRQLSATEQGGAAVGRGATFIKLSDGRIYSGVTMRRGDLRQAIAILKAVGVPELEPGRVRTPAAATPANDWRRDLLAMLDEIEALAGPPLVPAQLERANRLALSMARRAPQGRVANLSMQLMSAAHEARGAEHLPESFRLIAARLRVALAEDAMNPGTG